MLIIVFALLSDSFLNFANLVTMTKHVAYNAILALGMLFVILKGGIDLSVGSTVGLSGVVAGTLLQGWQLEPVRHRRLSAGLGRRGRSPSGSGLLVGFVNGVLITRFNVAPFIATLGMLYIARGAALLDIERHDLPAARRQ